MTITHLDKERKWTAKEFLMLDESNVPCQLINGELIISPSPTPYHQDVLGNLYLHLKSVAKKTGGTVYLPVDLHVDGKNVFQPDLVYVSPESKYIVGEKKLDGPPELVIEILSPSTAKFDKGFKRKTYLSFGVKEYWIIDTKKKTLEVFTQKVESAPLRVFHEPDEVSSIVLPQLSFQLKTIF